MKIEWRSCLKVGVTVFVLYLCMHYWRTLASFAEKVVGAASPVIIGLAAAYILNILMSFYERHYFPRSKKNAALRTRRPVCMVLAVVSLLGAVALIIGLVIPELVQCIKFLLSEIPPILDRIVKSRFVTETLPADILAELSVINWREHLTNIAGVLVSGIGDAADIILTTVTSLFSGIVTAFISVIFTLYLLLDRDRLKYQCLSLMDCYLPARVKEKLLYCLRIFNKCFHRYIVGQCTEAVILGLLCSLGMLIFRFPYAGMIGALIGFTALIPIAGAYIGAAVGAVMILTESPLKALLFIVFIVVLQQLEGNIIYPRVVGKSIGLPALWVLAAVTVGGGLFGIVGMLIGVPITAALYRIIRSDVRKRRASADGTTGAVGAEAVSSEAVVSDPSDQPADKA